MNINPVKFREMIPPEDPTKIGRVLHRLCCGESFNRFQAEPWLHDHTLNSTISTLANSHLIKINRVPEIVPGYAKKPTRCIRYSIDHRPENLAKCYWLLKSWGWRDQPTKLDPPSPPEAA